MFDITCLYEIESLASACLVPFISGKAVPHCRDAIGINQQAVTKQPRHLSIEVGGEDLSVRLLSCRAHQIAFAGVELSCHQVICNE